MDDRCGPGIEWPRSARAPGRHDARSGIAWPRSPSSLGRHRTRRWGARDRRGRLAGSERVAAPSPCLDGQKGRPPPGGSGGRQRVGPGGRSQRFGLLGPDNRSILLRCVGRNCNRPQERNIPTPLATVSRGRCTVAAPGSATRPDVAPSTGSGGPAVVRTPWANKIARRIDCRGWRQRTIGRPERATRPSADSPIPRWGGGAAGHAAGRTTRPNPQGGPVGRAAQPSGGSASQVTGARAPAAMPLVR